MSPDCLMVKCEERNDLKAELLKGKQTLDNSQSAHSATEKERSEENTKDVAKRPFDREIGMGVDQPQQQEDAYVNSRGRNEGSGLLRFYRMGP